MSDTRVLATTGRTLERIRLWLSPRVRFLQSFGRLGAENRHGSAATPADD